MSAPRVYDYLDFRAFLRDWFDARKRLDPSYSLAVFARAGDCSKAALANVLSGERTPRAESLDAFARAMALEPAERRYLGLLVDLAAAPDIETRRRVLDQILASERFGKVREAEAAPAEDVFRFFGAWYLPAIYELASLPGFRDDPAWVAAQLVPPISAEQAADALSTLFELETLTREPDGRVVQRAIRFRTAPETAQIAIARYQRESVPEMLRRLDTANSAHQHVLAATFTLDAALLTEAKLRLTAVADQLATAADEGTSREGRRVYQLAVQLLPLSVAPPEPEATDPSSSAD